MTVTSSTCNLPRKTTGVRFLVVSGLVLLSAGGGLLMNVESPHRFDDRASDMRQDIGDLRELRAVARSETKRLQSQDWDTVAPPLEVPFVIREMNLSRELLEMKGQQSWEDGLLGLGQLTAGWGGLQLLLAAAMWFWPRTQSPKQPAAP